ncbi:MAG: nuclear transport factor 2 family protein [Acidobacteriota bacterium]|jgi:hypothetical protein|nr:nuclear transport factor 2 family protein [Acidobacteriota bacterium]
MADEKSQTKAARRSFLFKSGAALTGALAATVAASAKPSQPTPGRDGALALKLGVLEDREAVRGLYRAYEASLSEGRYEDAASHFAARSEAVFGGERFSGRDEGVRRLFTEKFREGRTGRKADIPASLHAEPLAESIEVGADRQTAKAVFPYSMRVGEPMDASLQLVQMARLHGEGILYRQESGLCELSLVREGAGWKIARAEYRAI